MTSQLSGGHLIEKQIVIDIERDNLKQSKNDNRNYKDERNIKVNMMLDRNKQISNYLKLKTNRISKKLRHLSILKTQKDIGIIEKPKDIKSSLHNSALLVCALNKKDEPLKKYCEIDLKSYSVEKSSKSKCENIVERLVNRKKRQNSQSTIFKKNESQNLYKRYKKMQKRAVTQLPKLISSRQKSIENRRQYNQRIKINHAISHNDINTYQKCTSSNHLISHGHTNSYQNNIKIKRIPHKSIFNKIEPAMELQQDPIIEGSICPWMNPVNNNHIQISTITRYNSN